jgi:hypothetical protein
MKGSKLGLNDKDEKPEQNSQGISPDPTDLEIYPGRSVVF